MDQKALEKKFQELTDNKEFLEKFNEADTASKVKALFAESDLVISEEDAALLIKASVASDESVTLSEKELEQVSGGVGWAWTVITKGLPLIAKGALCLKRNLRRDGSMVKCECGLHGYAVRK